MEQLPKKLQKKLDNRKANNALRNLGTQNHLVDFSSNDYLGFSKSETIFNNTHNYLLGHHFIQNGATGSRLLSGNHPLYNVLESILCEFHKTEASLIFNSGYDANLGFFSSVPQRGDIILYDEFIHASIRDGIKLSNAQAFKFKHNSLEALEELMGRHAELVSESHQDIYVVTESVFSMDGDSPDLMAMSKICKNHNALLIIDEAHAIGVFEKRGVGLVQSLNLEKDIFARIITFGKALGCHGAAILGSAELKQYLVNFSRGFIYTTGLSPHALATIKMAYKELDMSKVSETSHNPIQRLSKNITFFKSEIRQLQLQNRFIESNSAIQCCVISGNKTVKSISKQFQENGFDIKAILSPTVPKNQERLRFCLHAFNSEKEITDVLQLLATFVTKLY